MKNITIITGGSRGLGKELAKEFLLRGENVCIIARNAKNLERAKSDLEKLTNNEVVTYAGDVSDEKFVKKFYSDITKKYQIKCLVNNAGVSMSASVFENSQDVIDKTFPTVIYGTILMTTYALPHIKDSKDIVKIVNIISEVVQMPYEGASVYCAAKMAQKGYAECLRLETFGTNIKVVNVYPGGMNTDFWKNHRKSISKQLQQTFADPKDVANLIVESLYNRNSIILKDIIVEQTHMNLK